MSEKINDGGSAFPHEHYREAPQKGATLRDYFAAKAMQADIATVERGHDWRPHVDEFARCAYAMADAMLAAREVQS